MRIQKSTGNLVALSELVPTGSEEDIGDGGRAAT